MFLAWAGLDIVRANSFHDSTLVYVEGDASMRSYENAEGQKQHALNIVQRMCSYLRGFAHW